MVMLHDRRARSPSCSRTSKAARGCSRPAGGVPRRARPPRRPASGRRSPRTAASSSRRAATASAPPSPARRGGRGRRSTPSSRCTREPWGELGPIRVRMGLHTGEVERPGRRLLRGAAPPLRPADGQRPRRAGGALGGDGGAGARCAAARGLARRTSASTACATSPAPERVYQLVATGPARRLPAAAHAGRRPEQPADPGDARSSGASSSSRRSGRALLRPDAPAAHADRPGRHRQDAPGAAGGRRPAGQLPGRRLLRPAGAGHRSGPGPVGHRPGARRAGGRRPLDRRRRWRTPCARSSSCWCWTTSSRSWPPRRSWPSCSRPRPGLKVLVTSRAVLRLYGERELPSRRWRCPDRRTAPSAAHLAQFEAVRLFVDRAQAARSDFALTDENAAGRGRDLPSARRAAAGHRAGRRPDPGAAAARAARSGWSAACRC